MPDESQNTETNQKIKNVESLLQNKEYDQVIQACQDILDQDPTNQTALSLMKEAHEAKMTMLRSNMQQNTPSGMTLPSLTPQIPVPAAQTPSIPENPTPEIIPPKEQIPSVADTFALKEEKTQPENDKEEIPKPKPQSLEEIFSQPKVQMAEVPSGMMSAPPQTSNNPTTTALPDTPKNISAESGIKNLNKRKIADIVVKVILALLLVAGVYYTYQVYIAPKPAEESVPEQEADTEEKNDENEPTEKDNQESDQKEENEDDFVVTPEDEEASETDSLEPDEGSTEPTTEEPPKKKVRRVPVEEETKEMY